MIISSSSNGVSTDADDQMMQMMHVVKGTANSDINPIGLRQIIKAILRKAQEK